MRNSIAICAGVLLWFNAIAQAPEKISYQAVIRDANQALVTNTAVGMQISLLQGSPNGPALYIERHNPVTNANGLATLQIGDGVILIGSFAAINWGNGPYFIQVDTDPMGGTNYTVVATTQLLSVPYALHAKTAETVSGGVIELDPIFAASVASSISASDTASWNNKLDSFSEVDPIFAASVASSISASDTASWNNKLDNFSEVDPIFTASVASSISASDTASWNSKLDSFSEVDPVFAASIASSISAIDIANWDLDNDPQNEIQILSIQSDTLFLSNSGFVVLPAGFSGNYADLNGVPNFQDSIAAYGFGGNYDSLYNQPALALVATTGAYDDLINGPVNLSFFTNDVGYVNQLNDDDPTNEIQQLSASTTGDTLRLQNGGFVIIPGLSAANHTGGGVLPNPYPAGYVHCNAANPTAIVDVTNPSTGKTWMDRNLGASQAATSSKDANAYGDLYQWGRWADGHQCRTSATTTTLSSTDQPAHGDFIIISGGATDWRSPENINLWQGVNGINNPCPSGYRVPTEIELNEERISWSSQDSLGAIGSPLKFPLAGSRAFAIQGSDIRGDYWTATINGARSRSLFFSAGALINTNVRAQGYSVRCIKETGGAIQGSINSLDCSIATNTGTLTNGVAASGASSSIPYTGGNGGAHSGQTVNSSGVIGLTATLTAGNFTNGSGSVVYAITGTPTTSGTASFALNIGGQSCAFTLLVSASATPPPTYPAGYVHCNAANPTAIMDVTNPSTGKTWMDRNLGASQAATSSKDANAYGDLYQWGRGADGHQCRTSATTTTLSSTDQPAHGDFIIISGGATDWRSPENINLWQGVNGINNPCPSGYRVPTEIELNEERISWSSQDSLGAIGSPLKFPLAGSRAFAIQGSDIRGDYWTATINGARSRSLFFSAGALINTNVRAQGYSVRCIKETGGAIQGSINSLDCSIATNTGTLTNGVAASGASSSIPYTGGNGGAHSGQTVNSSGVIGLTATLTAGNFTNGSGSVVYAITGTPTTSGTASFALNIGGQSCAFTFPIDTTGTTPPPGYPLNQVHCNPANPTAIVDIASPITNKIWMDRNLGASQVATSSTDANAYGDLYQWGRGADGHQCRNSATTSTLSSTDQPAHGEYIISLNATQDWLSPQNNNLWQGVNGANNPCPSGYRLPSETEINAERLSWSSADEAGAFNSPLKLTKAGYRANGNGVLANVGGIGLYWSSTVSSTDSRFLYFNNSSAFIIPYARSRGLSIRCLKDNATPSQGLINSLECNTATNIGAFTTGFTTIGVSSIIPYTGGNGGIYIGQTVNSTGVTGLIATLIAGSFANGSGNLTYTFSGTPATSGIASFALNIGGQSCVLTRSVGAPVVSPSYPSGYVHCNPSIPTAIVDVTNPTTNKIWMDRNLGALQVATSSTDANGYGDLYQWGRRADGHQCRTSNTTSTLSSIDQPGHGNFIVYVGFYDWRLTTNDNLWQGLNGINNPCPAGYRLPTEAEFDAERLSWSSNNATGAFASPLKLSLAGYRDHSTGLLGSVGTGGIYWSSSVVGSSYTVFLSFDNNSGGTYFDITRSMGYSVRCIKN
jgi:uncharacterized protein (TIGR02145 family)